MAAYSFGTFNSSSADGVMTIDDRGVNIALGSAADLRGQRQYNDPFHTLYQEGGEPIAGLNEGTALANDLGTVMSVPSDRVADASLTGSVIRLPGMNCGEPLTLSPWASGVNAAMTSQRWNSRIDDRLTNCTPGWCPEITGSALTRLRECYYPTDSSLRWGLHYTSSSTLVMLPVCPDAPVTHPGDVVPLLFYRSSDSLNHFGTQITRGPLSGRFHIAVSGGTRVYTRWVDGEVGPHLVVTSEGLTPGYFRPWWGLPPELKYWLLTTLDLPTASPTPTVQLKVYLDEEIVDLSVGGGVTTQETLLTTDTVPLSSRWAFSGATDICSWGTIYTTSSVGTMDPLCVGFRYRIEYWRDGIQRATFIANTQTPSFPWTMGAWHKSPPGVPRYGCSGGTDELSCPMWGVRVDI